MRILLVDDEASCRETLRIFLEKGCPEVTAIEEASSLAEACETLPRFEPDLLLLDIDLGDGTGFDLLDRFPQPDFKIIFTTAYDEFALKAFRYSALDYLLKPTDPEELAAAVRKLNMPEEVATYHRQIEQFRYHNQTQSFDRITLNTGKNMFFIGTEEITRLESNGNYSFVFLENGERHLATKPLIGFEEMLPCPPFFRTHQSHIVNTKFVRKLSKDEGDYLMMVDKTIVPLARRRKDDFLRIMK